MDQYISYHKKPYAKYLDVQSFNAKYGTDIKDVEDYDLYFEYIFTEARRMQGPDDFLQVNFVKQDQFEEMGIKDWLKKKASNAAKALKAGKNYLKDKIAGKKDDTSEAKKTEAKKAEAKKAEAIKPEAAAPKVNDLDELLSEEDDVVEEEYEEVETAAVPVERKTNIVTEKKQIADLVLKTSKDSEECARDMKHIIRFRSAKLPLEEQIMKGRPKYLKALRSYLKGDKDVEVKMSWRKGSKMVKVSDLNPQRASLKALLRTSATGNIRVVECV